MLVNNNAESLNTLIEPSEVYFSRKSSLVSIDGKLETKLLSKVYG